jgi:hypothetical protein
MRQKISHVAGDVLIFDVIPWGYLDRRMTLIQIMMISGWLRA